MLLQPTASLRVALLVDAPAVPLPLHTQLLELGVRVVAVTTLAAAPPFDPAQVDLRVAQLGTPPPASLALIAALGRVATPPVLLLYERVNGQQVLAASALGISGHGLTSLAGTELAAGLLTVARGGLFICPAIWAMFGQRAELAAGLTAADAQVIRLASSGHSNGLIAAVLGLTPKAVEYRLRQLCRKLQLANKTALAAWWSRRLALLDAHTAEPSDPAGSAVQRVKAG